MTPDEKKLALKTELLIDPAVYAPTVAELDAIKEEYRNSIRDSIAAGMDYGPQTDEVIANHLSAIKTGTRAVDATAWDFRRVLLRGYGSWGKIELIAAQTPFYYGLSSITADKAPRVAAKPMAAKPTSRAKPVSHSLRAKPKPSTLVEAAPKPALPRTPGPSETELVRNMLCRNLMAILRDPQMVFHGEDYETIHDSISGLVAQTLLTVEEGEALYDVMMGKPVTLAYNKYLVDLPADTIAHPDVAVALRTP